MEEHKLLIHSFIESSRVNGPGNRAVIWTRGCTLNCPGCFNKETHPSKGGESSTISDLLKRVLAAEEQFNVEGITISGGEPLQQKWPLIRFLQLVRHHTNLSVVLFTGYSGAEIWRMPGSDFLPSLCDVIIAGRYDQKQRVADGLIGSSNKQLIFFGNRYKREDFVLIPQAEVLIKPSGEVVYSGIRPVQPSA